MGLLHEEVQGPSWRLLHWFHIVIPHAGGGWGAGRDQTVKDFVCQTFEHNCENRGSHGRF